MSTGTRGDYLEEMRLQKYLAMCSAASRRGSEKLIADGRVSVNGEVVTKPGTKVSRDDEVLLDGRRVFPDIKKIYVMLNKPAGYLSAVTDIRGRKTVMELVGEIKERIYPVGRLDLDTEGLLLMTNDGDFTYSVTHPSHGTKKNYEALVAGIMEHGAADRLRKGVVIDGRKTAPAEVEILSHKANSTLVSITIHEGRNRQVRKMCQAVGHPVTSLKRKSIGSLSLGTLPLGRWRYLSEDEVKRVLNNG